MAWKLFKSRKMSRAKRPGLCITRSHIISCDSMERSNSNTTSNSNSNTCNNNHNSNSNSYD